MKDSTSPSPSDHAQLAVEVAVRASYGRLVAYLAARWRDVAAAEDALSDALMAALRTWPIEGVPAHAEAWLMTVAHRRLLDGARHSQVKQAADDALRQETTEAFSAAQSAAAFPDRRLALMFVCAHPAIAEDIRTPLILQTVLGLDAGRIAGAFLVAPATMGQRLSRAKTKIRAARIRFELPEPCELPGRTESVLEAIYAAFGAAWENISGADASGPGLANEAVGLGRLVVAQLPDEPEARGLLALMLHCEARRTARRDQTGAYVPIARQDVARWSRPLMEEAEAHLRHAALSRRIGRFQLEAAIQSAHAQRAFSGQADWKAIVQLYDGLVRLAPTIGALVGRASAIAEAQDANSALAALAALPADLVRNYQPFWALQAALHQRLGHTAEAAAANHRAQGLTTDPAIRDYLARSLNPQ